MCNNKKELCDIKILVLKLMCLFNKNKFFDIKLGTLILYILYIKANKKAKDAVRHKIKGGNK